MSNAIKVGDTVRYTGHYSMTTVDHTKLKVEAIIPSAELLVASGINEAGNIKCIMSGIRYFSLNKKSEAEKLQDLLRDVGNDAFCKIMAETIEEHNKLHKHILSNLEILLSRELVTGTSATTYVHNMILSITQRLDK